MNKLRTQIILAFNIFFLVVVGSSILIYFLFAEDYYIFRKKNFINEAFRSIQQYDIIEMGQNNEDLFLPFEEESYSILICNEDFECVYSSNIRDYEPMILSRIEKHSDKFTPDATASYAESAAGSPVFLRGLISQDGENYYVYIYENTKTISRGIAFANRLLVIVLLLVLVLGSIFAYCLASWIVKPVEKIQKVANKISKNDFSSRLPAKQPNNELGQLAGDINHMADKIQRDINDLNNYTYLLLKQNRDMAEFEDMRKKLVGNITHELKTPLAIISSQVELLQYEYDPGKKDYYCSSIMEEIEKMSRLISSILKSSQMENRIQHADLRWENLSDLLFDLIPKYESWLSSKKIVFTSSIEEDCMAHIDKLQIEQAVNNYMMNATRHTKPGRNVHLTLKSEAESFYLSVYNDGPRLPEPELSNVWTGFYQTGAQGTGSTMEIGLGLYIVKDILNHHNGTCGVVNRENGIEFYIRLPKG